MEWILDNKEWIFSGIGVFILSLIIGVVARRKSIQKQNSGDNSTNLQSGGNIKIG